mgnify:CR=1 FL=1
MKNKKKENKAIQIRSWGGNMAKDKSGNNIREVETEKSIVEGWVSITKEYRAGELNEQEKAQFGKARFADEQTQRKSFTLGGQINRHF